MFKFYSFNLNIFIDYIIQTINSTPVPPVWSQVPDHSAGSRVSSATSRIPG